MAEQNYANHARYDPLFHFVLVPLTLATSVGSFVNLYKSIGDHQRLYNASLIVALTISMTIAGYLCRIYALKAQDRAIRAEENLRHFALTGKLLDQRLTIGQIIALRFAPDGEFVALAARAAAEAMKPDDVKRAIKAWRADLYRV